MHFNNMFFWIDAIDVDCAICYSSFFFFVWVTQTKHRTTPLCNMLITNLQNALFRTEQYMKSAQKAQF